MGFVALAFAGIMLIRYKSVADKFYQAIDWDLLGFFSALFVVINVMEHAAVLELIGKGLAFLIDDSGEMASAGLLAVSALFSSVTDNIPLAAMLSKILVSTEPAVPAQHWWAVIFGANLGGNLTPIGSASTLVAVTIIHKYGISLSFAGFVRKALPYALVHISLAIAYLVLFF